jgi:hypothetical protein
MLRIYELFCPFDLGLRGNMLPLNIAFTVNNILGNSMLGLVVPQFRCAKKIGVEMIERTGIEVEESIKKNLIEWTGDSKLVVKGV